MPNAMQRYADKVLPEAEPQGEWLVMPDGERITSYDEIDRMARYLARIAPHQNQTLGDV